MLNLDEEWVNIWPPQSGTTVTLQMQKTHDNYGYTNCPGIERLDLRAGKIQICIQKNSSKPGMCEALW